MNYKQFLIILSGAGNRRVAVKISGDFDGNNYVKISLKDMADLVGGELYLIGDNITKLSLESDKTEYKTYFYAKSDIICLVKNGVEILLGGTGKVPVLRNVVKRIEEWEKVGRKESERTDDKIVQREISLEQERVITSKKSVYVKETAVGVDMPKNEDSAAEGEHNQEGEVCFNSAESIVLEVMPDEIESIAYDVAENPISEVCLDNRANSNEADKDSAGKKYNFREALGNDDKQENEESIDLKKTSLDNPSVEQSISKAKESEKNAVQGRHRDAVQGRHRDAVQPASVAAVLNNGIRYDGTNFYLAIKPQLDELFVRYPEEKTLNSIVPNSKWVRVDAEDGYYVVGLLYDVSAPSFICYGIPSAFQKQPPSEIADVCVWLPLDLNKRDGEGYWVIYQSAVDGKCIR